MKKKLILSAAMAALLIGTGVTSASASTVDTKVEKKVYVYQYKNVNFDRTNINEFLSEYLKSLPIKINVHQQSKPVTTEKKQNNHQNKQQSQAVPQGPVSEKTPSQQKIEKEPTEQKTETTNEQVSAFEQQVVDLTNKERAKNGLPALQLDTNLSKVAREKSLDMQKNGYFSHTSPTYGSPFDMMKKFGISYKTAGENIAMGQKSPEEVVNAWMNSEGHRANILNGSFTHIGVGHVSNGNYWTQMFIGK